MIRTYSNGRLGPASGIIGGTTSSILSGAVSSGQQAAAGGKNPRLVDAFALHKLTDEQDTTFQSILTHERTRVVVSPNHHINEFRDTMGFRFDCDPSLAGTMLPLVRTMFHGHTLVECREQEDTILRLMSSTAANKDRMRQFLEQVLPEPARAARAARDRNVHISVSS